MNEFDSQLEIVRVFAHIEGRNQERERIIKLLIEANPNGMCQDNIDHCYGDSICVCELIALIKGENK